MIEQFTETKLTIMIVAMNLALMDNLIEANVIITFVVYSYNINHYKLV